MSRFLILLVAALPVLSRGSDVAGWDAAFGAASARMEDGELVVSSGVVERRWSWTGRGLATTGLRDLRSGYEWINLKSDQAADWDFPALTEGSARLLSVTANESDDEGFTSAHLSVVAEMEYPGTGTLLKYVIRAYPDAPGLHTQVWLKGEPQEVKPAGGAVSIDVVSGKPHKIPAGRPEHAVAPACHTSTLFQGKEVELKIEGLDHRRAYKAMLSWWDTGSGIRRTQSVSVLSMDGESARQVIPPTVLPSFRDQAMPSEAGFAIPPEVRIGDTVRVKIRKEQGVNAHLSEFWIYEEGRAAEPPALRGDPERINALRTQSPEGYHLAAYLDCGGADPVEQRAASTGVNRVDFLPMSGNRITAFGYFNDTQHRHTPEHHMYREEVLREPAVDWASVLFADSGQGGLAWVKESHKCVNRPGVDTGAFISDAAGWSNTGSALSAADLSPDAYRWCWAAWTVLYPEDSQYQRELAMKQFDRARFPVDPQRDVFVKANTWGSGNSAGESIAMAAETEVLKEIQSVADLGIDVLQIDDGWQFGRSAMPQKKSAEWRVRSDWYPDGWKNVVDAAASKNVKLGLWTAARAGLDDLKLNYDEAGFVTWKYDFAHIKNYSDLYRHWSKLRAFLLYTDHKARMAVDVTENAPRFGYFWARDFGCVWLSNRKPNNPPNTIPKPILMLRENRELSRYVNLNKFELPIQNFARVNQQQSDARLYGHPYEVALGLMGIPTFFQTTYHYEGKARDDVRGLIGLYKAHQQELYQHYVFAIGDVPDQAAWSGFQWCRPDTDVGYLLVFRERKNEEPQRKIPVLNLRPGQTIEWTDLRTGQEECRTVTAHQALELRMDKPADFIFLKYRLLETPAAGQP
ncbi:alpha-galactosidase [Pontiella sp.]|uniref:alpha-galactosidase n=1 Tax=Pontiella sp. TaxID=2837462 RepID=UPI00356221EE